MRRFLLRGDESGLAAALELCHCLRDVQSVVEREGELELWLEGELPALDELPVRAVELPLPPAGPTLTGFEHDVAIVVDDGLVVRPPWVASPAGFAGLELVVPRGMAFGSGEHGSTQAALLVMAACWPSPPPARVLDVGTGSGVLALYAQRRGAAAVGACDVESEAVAAARALLGTADVRLGGPAVFAGERFPFVVANLDARQLHAALPDLLARLAPAGTLVVAGLRPVELDAFAARVPAAPSLRRERLGYVGLGYVGLGGAEPASPEALGSGA